MYTNDRHAYRQAFFTVWQKYQKKLPLEALELQLVEIILLHPEYHSLLSQSYTLEKQEFALEENPFFHMSLHLALREQIQQNRPQGVKLVYQQLQNQYQNVHETEHAMMRCLAKVMWTAQESGVAPKEEDYLAMIKALLIK